jgi:hypothetical protein
MSQSQTLKNIKIVEGIDKISAKEDSLDSVVPDPISGPESLHFLNGVCFNKLVDRFEYNVCPFQNITQRRITGNYPTILGVWGSWQDASGIQQANQIVDFKTMNYVEGKSCGESKVDTKLILECEHNGEFEIISVDDSTFCTYVVKLGLPMACSLFKR